MDFSTTLKRFGVEQLIRYLHKDPEKNMLRLMDWADKFAKGEFVSQRKLIREAISNPAHPYYPFVRRLFTDLDEGVMQAMAANFFINAALMGWPKQEEMRQKYGCNIPWTILLDPTSACNLHCTGCWAAEYGNKLNLTFDEIDNITHETKKKNYDTSKFRGFIDLGYSLGMGAPRNDYWLVETSFGYEFTPHYYLGLGVGLHNFEAKVGSYPMRYDLTVPEHINPDWKYPFIPVYVEGRYHVKSENGNTPFVSLKLGATFINHAGFFASPTLGYHLASNRFFSFNVGLGYALQTATYKAWCTGETPGAIPDHSGKSYLKKTSLFHNALVKVGVEF